MLETLLSSLHTFLFTPPHNPKRWVLLLLHFTDEETEVPSGDVTLRVTQSARGRAGIPTQALRLQRVEEEWKEHGALKDNHDPWKSKSELVLLSSSCLSVLFSRKPEWGWGESISDKKGRREAIASCKARTQFVSFFFFLVKVEQSVLAVSSG